MPYLKLAAVHDENARKLTVFALNRHLQDELVVDFTTKGFPDLAVSAAQQLHDEDLKAMNTGKQRGRIKPLPLRDVRIRKGGLSATLLPASWNVIRMDVRK